MQQPWTSFLRLGIVHFMAFPETQRDESRLLTTLERIAFDPFFQVIEVKGIGDARLRAQARELLRAAHLDVAYAAQPLVLGQKLDIGAAEEAERRRAVDALRAAVDEAVELGAQAFGLLSGPDPGPQGRPAATARTIDSLVEVTRHAEGAGLTVALEVFDREIDKRALLGPTPEAAAVARAVRASSPRFGLMLDLSHLPLQGETTTDALRAAADVLVHAHVGNCVLRDPRHPAYGDQHPRFGLPGGENDVAELAAYLSGLFEIGYLGSNRWPLPVVSFEVKPLPGEDPEVVLANAKRTWLAAWARVEAEEAQRQERARR